MHHYKTTLLKQFTHNIQTPLATIKQSVQGLKIFLPKLLDGYTMAENAKLISDKIDDHHLNILHRVLSHIENSADLINKQITILNQHHGE